MKRRLSHLFFVNTPKPIPNDNVQDVFATKILNYDPNEGGPTSNISMFLKGADIGFKNKVEEELELKRQRRIRMLRHYWKMRNKKS